jgi:sialate O-acetylesterase
MKRTALLMFALVVCTGFAHAEFRVAQMFTDHLVLQRDIDVPVWGWTTPGKSVTVEFGGQKVTAKADENTGKWMVRLKPMDANTTGQVMKITADGKRRQGQPLSE